MSFFGHHLGGRTTQPQRQQSSAGLFGAGDHIHLWAAQHLRARWATAAATAQQHLRRVDALHERPAPAGGRAAGQGQQGGQAMDAQTQFAQPTARIGRIAPAWNAAGPGCQFQARLFSFILSSPPLPSGWIHPLPPSLLPPVPSVLPSFLHLSFHPSFLPLPFLVFLLCILLRPILTLPTGLTTVKKRTQYIFYHRVVLYGRPPNGTNDALWARAEGGRAWARCARGEARAQGISSADWYNVMRARRVLRCDSSASVFRILGCISRGYGGSSSSSSPSSRWASTTSGSGWTCRDAGGSARGADEAPPARRVGVVEWVTLVVPARRAEEWEAPHSAPVYPSRAVSPALAGSAGRRASAPTNSGAIAQSQATVDLSLLFHTAQDRFEDAPPAPSLWRTTLCVEVEPGADFRRFPSSTR
ncbi:hypothetical protein DFH08DRAFT_958874 [Mycena albidolilacea]|uniref:Uncharacterized protein n=1 Tax=Mycena albidolilacea TaxID=1033008 RepID=A0AAD7A5I2_9AGAR|nr:hypothetical protein DFH08DRAFT_958874 [Mycena albidolilacea]